MNNRRLLLNLNDEDMKKIPLVIDGTEIYCDDTSVLNAGFSGSETTAKDVNLLLAYDIIFVADTTKVVRVIKASIGSNSLNIWYPNDYGGNYGETDYIWFANMTKSGLTMRAYTGSKYDI